jgi:hypothetical protein
VKGGFSIDLETLASSASEGITIIPVGFYLIPKLETQFLFFSCFIGDQKTQARLDIDSRNFLLVVKIG